MSSERRTAPLELRAIADGRAPRRLTGYAAVFDSPSADLGGFTEIVRSSAFDRTLRSGEFDPLALLDHLPHLVLGRKSADTLRLQKDSRGLAFEIDLPDTTVARDLYVSVERRDIRGASFKFKTPKGGDKWSMRDGKALRELIDIDLLEITITASPAYDATVAQARALSECAILSLRRSMPKAPRVTRAKLWMDTF